METTSPSEPHEVDRGIETQKKEMLDMARRVQIAIPAPDFSLQSFTGEQVRLSDYRDERHVFLVFNRGFF